MSKRLKIFKTPWHIGHDHDLITALKDVADFDLLVNYTRRWDERNRPLPSNTKWVNHFEKGKYDLAILNIDQQCTNPKLNKSILTQEMKEVIEKLEPSLPIIFINHATPVYPENFPDGVKANDYVSPTLKKEIMDIIGSYPMIVNSKQALKDWHIPDRGVEQAIWHGIDANEWKNDKVKEPRVCCFISAGGIGDRYYNRSYLVSVQEELRESFGIELQWINSPNNWHAKDIKDYKEFLAKSLVYFNPTFASPMPRSRTEAMLSGCCIVTTPQHDADEFIVDGHNGFLVPHNDVIGTAKLIAGLIDDYKKAKVMGANARETAIKLFNRKRYSEDWIKFLTDLKILK